ncbi:Mono [ADP-ribose] polymerase PARP16, partial [Eschrichtius robustus]|nr:Mono [ADP-ribose] polymerase PARP16 [Eschrichtius robustus]
MKPHVPWRLVPLLADASKLPNLKELLQSSGDKDTWAWDLVSWILSSKVLTIHSAGKSETSLFGEGTYLTSDLSLALIYSPHGHGWQRSLLGPILSCVAVCEVIDHPDVKCQTKKKEDEIDHFIFFEPEVVAYTLKICFSLCSNVNSFFPLKQGFKPALLGFQPLVYGHDNPVSAAAAHNSLLLQL